MQECDTENVKTNYKKYLKQLIIDNFLEDEIIKSVMENKPKKNCTSETTETALDEAINQNQTENLSNFFKVSQLIRNEVLSSDKR